MDETKDTRRAAIKKRIKEIKSDSTKSRSDKKKEIGANKAFSKGGMAGFASYAAKQAAKKARRDKK